MAAVSSTTAISTTSYDESKPGFPLFRMNHGSGKASAEVFLNGATVASWKVLDHENLFMRSDAPHQHCSKTPLQSPCRAAH